MITLSAVTRRYGAKTVLENLSFTFPEKGIIALMAPSGAGKTTLLRLLAGIDKPDGGLITGLPQKKAVSFQEPRLIPWLSCKENITFVLPKGEDAEKKAEEWLARLELTDVGNKRPDALSGGMKQRLSLARALAFSGELLILDEPFSALDRDLKERIIPFVKNANPEGLTVMVTHNREDADALGAEVYTLEGTPVGKITRI